MRQRSSTSVESSQSAAPEVLDDRLGRRRSTLVAAGPDVVDDFPTAMPVTRGELEVIETYLGALLDEALGKRE
jgi:hypothetical protein